MQCMVGMAAAETDLAEASKFSASSESCCVADMEDCCIVAVGTARDTSVVDYHCLVVGMVQSSLLASLLNYLSA